MSIIHNNLHVGGQWEDLTDQGAPRLACVLIRTMIRRKGLAYHNHVTFP